MNLIARQKKLEERNDVSHMRLAGHPYEILDNKVKMATCDAYKDAVGQIRTGDLLMMVRNDVKPMSFFVLRVLSDTPAPLSTQGQQASFAIGKKALVGRTDSLGLCKFPVLR